MTPRFASRHPSHLQTAPLLEQRPTRNTPSEMTGHKLMHSLLILRHR